MTPFPESKASWWPGGGCHLEGAAELCPEEHRELGCYVYSVCAHPQRRSLLLHRCKRVKCCPAIGEQTSLEEAATECAQVRLKENGLMHHRTGSWVPACITVSSIEAWTVITAWLTLVLLLASEAVKKAPPGVFKKYTLCIYEHAKWNDNCIGSHNSPSYTCFAKAKVKALGHAKGLRQGWWLFCLFVCLFSFLVSSLSRFPLSTPFYLCFIFLLHHFLRNQSNRN